MFVHVCTTPYLLADNVVTLALLLRSVTQPPRLRDPPPLTQSKWVFPLDPLQSCGLWGFTGLWEFLLLSAVSRVSNQANLLSEVDGSVMDNVNQHVDDFVFNITRKRLPRGVRELTWIVLVNHTCKKKEPNGPHIAFSIL